MALYEYKGQQYDLPDGMSNEEALNKIKSYLGEATAPVTTAAPTPAGVPAAAPQQAAPPSIMELMFGAGSPIARVVKGAIVDPALAANQLLANTGLFGQNIKQGANQLVRSYEQATTEGRQRVDSTGFDPFQLAGAVVSPLNKLVGAATAAPAGAGVLSRVGQSAATGAGLAAFTPVTGEGDFTSQKLTQMATGAVLGPVTEAAVKVGGKTISVIAKTVQGLTPAGREKALREYLDTLAGPDKPAVIEALRDAKQIVTGSRPTAAEALADVPTAAELLAAQKQLSKQTGQVGLFAERAAEQQAARARSLQAISGTPAERAALAEERGLVTDTMRETALDQANLAGPIFTKLEKEVADGFNSLAAATQTAGMVGRAATTQQATAVAGKPGWLTAGDISADAAKRAESYAQKAETLRANVQLKKYQLDSLETNGFFPLRASDIVDKLDSAIRGTVSDESRLVLQGVKEKILSKADENGIINSRDLYENVRKTLNQDIAKYLGQSEKYAQGGIPEQAAKSAGNVKKFIDAALDQSSDKLWSKYLNTYAEYSKKLNRMEIGDFLSKQLNTPLDKERAGVFATAVENAANTVKRSTGIPRYKNLSDILAPQEVAAVNNVLSDLNRLTRSQTLASKAGRLPEGQPSLIDETPALLSRTVTLIKTALEHLKRGNAAAFNENMGILMRDPAEMAAFMTKEVPKSRLSSFTSSLMNVMDEPTKAAFIQSFTVPGTASVLGQE